MAKQLKKVFKTKVTTFEDGNEIQKEVELAVRVPTPKEKQDARLVYAKAWRLALEGGAIMREALDRYLREQKLWDDLRQKQYDQLRRSILDGERRIKMGGNANLTKKQARDLAIQIGDWREELSDLLTERNRVDANTADALADQSQFNYFVAACTVYNDTNKPYFTLNSIEPSVDVYIDKATEQASIDAATKFAELWYGGDEETAEKLPEKKFLKDFGFADEKGRLVDKQGRLVDRKGRLIDENNRFVNEAGEFVDSDGQRVDADGQYVVDFAPFLDEDDEEVETVKAPPASAPTPEKVDEKVEEQEPAVAG